MSYGDYTETKEKPHSQVERLEMELMGLATAPTIAPPAHYANMCGEAARTIHRLRVALHRISEDASAFRGMGGSYRAVDDDPLCVSRELMAVYDAVFPNRWVDGQIKSSQPNHLMPKKS